jgi:AmpE protein
MEESMTILALLIALALERVAVKTDNWQCQHYAASYFQWLADKHWLESSASSFFYFLVALVPAALLSIVLEWLPDMLFEFVIQTLVLFLCVGSQTLRNTYKCFLQAANRGDYQSCYLYTQQMGHCDTKPDQADSFGLRLVWLNYQHYAGVVIAFVIFGAPGALFYVVAREAFEFTCGNDDYPSSPAQTMRNWVDWVPVRIASLGMLLVGNFAHGLPVWLGSLFNFKESPVTTLTKVSAAAEILPSPEASEEDPTLEPAMLVKLAKRNMTFILVVVSLLTVSGIL